MDGPSLGRKRPRRAAISEETAAQIYAAVQNSATPATRHKCCNALNALCWPQYRSVEACPAQLRPGSFVSNFCALKRRKAAKTKKGPSRSDGPSLGRKRPRRAATRQARLGDVAVQNIGRAFRKGKCKNCRAAITGANGRNVWNLAAGPPMDARRGMALAPKRGRSSSERPKSREETPVLGCGSEEVLPRYRRICMRLFAVGSNLPHLLCQCLR